MEPLIQARNSSLPTLLSTSECVSNSNQLPLLFSHLESAWEAGNYYLTKLVTSVTKGRAWREVVGWTDFLPCEALLHRDCSGTLTGKVSFDFLNVFPLLPTLRFPLREKKIVWFLRGQVTKRNHSNLLKSFPFQTDEK